MVWSSLQLGAKLLKLTPCIQLITGYTVVYTDKLYFDSRQRKDFFSATESPDRSRHPSNLSFRGCRRFIAVGKVAAMWTWTLTSIYCRCSAGIVLYIHSLTCLYAAHGVLFASYISRGRKCNRMLKHWLWYCWTYNDYYLMPSRV